MKKFIVCVANLCCLGTKVLFYPNRLRFDFSFAPFVSKKSGVTDYALQNRCHPTEIKTPKPLVRFFFLPKEAQKEKAPKKKNAVWGVSLIAMSDKG